LDLSTYKNDYQAAVKKLVDANRKGKPLPEPNITDALPNSLAQGKNLKQQRRHRGGAGPPNAPAISFGPQITIHKLRYRAKNPKDRH
jgi:hypothetical protein